MEKAVRLSSLLQFLDLCQRDRFDPFAVMLNLAGFCMGQHGSQLSDNAVVLFDGTVEVPEKE